MLPCFTNAQTMTMQLYPLQTVTVNSEQFLTGSKDGKPDVVAGELRVPNTGADRVPTTVPVVWTASGEE
jgi:hypothetical protein